MAWQENSSKINTTSFSIKKKFLASLRYLLLDFRTVPFIGALVVSYIFVENAVVATLMDYLLDLSGEENQRIAAIATNLQDGLSSFFFLFVSPISETYTGCFTMITFCTAAFIQGLMLLWTSTSTLKSNAVYAAIFFLALGRCSEQLLDKFLEYQLQENIKTRKLRQPKHGSTQSIKKKDLTDRVLATSWYYVPLIVGYIVIVCLIFTTHYETNEHKFRFSALLMGGTFLLFLFGTVWYKHEEMTVESNLRRIYRICKAALGKWKLKYPTSPNCYYKKDNKKNDLYESKNDKRLKILPRVPRLFKWLDKAAIVDEEYFSDLNVSFLKKQEKKGQLCSVKDVSEVKSLVPMIYLCFAFFAYSLLLATGNTFFVAQASIMQPYFTKNNGNESNDISALFLIKDGGEYLSRFVCFLISLAFQHFRAFRAFIQYLTCNHKKATIIRIGFGMICGVICSLIAWQVEVSRLQITKKGFVAEPNNSTAALIPQFSLLGMTEGLVDGGFTSLFHWHVAKSMQSFGDSFSGFVIGSGKLFIVPLVLIFRSWFGKTVNNSRLDRYYMMLGILNAAFFLVFAYYSFKYAYKEEFPKEECSKDDKPDTEDENFIPENSIQIQSENQESLIIEGSTEAAENFIPENNIEIQSGNQDIAVTPPTTATVCAPPPQLPKPPAVADWPSWQRYHEHWWFVAPPR